MQIKTEALKSLQIIPGVEKSNVGDLHLLRIINIKDLKSKNPHQLYDQMTA